MDYRVQTTGTYRHIHILVMVTDLRDREGRSARPRQHRAGSRHDHREILS